ncbi:type I-E CRISPR-associated protein Cas5/CasD [Umezawaea sp. Da 62-37]|uniref:type I-E CRISPR-associated protein Cas5/CasD n=1 Tax=Umezawaea sp. Da 62-37 TaxID=3075927 RepID=UPI0028F6F93B|nr:type I-E CRISPR-associated protein Cas5/CasD [Umezawaea sp. Da 62-37]WNV85009.1 type I-E CRISPR-associated protein Cas5/CasD [Umezawaea sp. Da 62-37]
MSTTSSAATAVLVLRLAAPLQSWGDSSEFNRRDTAGRPTKSGVIGLLAAAQGRARTDSITDLGDLSLGVRVDQPGTLLRDYHTVSDYRGIPLPSASLSAKGTQKPTGPAKHTHITQRFYLQDAIFLAAVHGPRDLIDTLRHALAHPAFPLALGRRSCVPTQPLLLADDTQPTLTAALQNTPWLVPEHTRTRLGAKGKAPATVTLATTVDATHPPSDHDDDLGVLDRAHDQPLSFHPLRRTRTTRMVRHGWVEIPTGLTGSDTSTTTAHTDHDPFALLGW